MRTTLTIDDDVVRALRRIERTTRRRMKDVVNEVLRRGLSAGARPLPPADRFTVPARAAGFRPGIDPLKLNQLVDELQAERFVAAHARHGGDGAR